MYDDDNYFRTNTKGLTVGSWTVKPNLDLKLSALAHEDCCILLGE
jgi:hypothetical protein